jgi:uncharacterized protein (TIGR02757 family)
MHAAGSEQTGPRIGQAALRDLLEEAYDHYNRPGFIEDDPVSIPHRYSRKEDIEIAGFFAAILAWGNRKTIIRSTRRLLAWMDDAPYGFITGFREQDLRPFAGFVHRTFNGDDCIFFLNALQRIYREHGGLEQAFAGSTPGGEAREAIVRFRDLFLRSPHLPRSEKHLADPGKNASAKRINMYLRWMVRRDDRGVDFGLWDALQPSMLMCPLDVHTGQVSRKLGLLRRRQSDWKAVEELTASLRRLDPNDPVRYDLALFGLGVNQRVP